MQQGAQRMRRTIVSVVCSATAIFTAAGATQAAPDALEVGQEARAVDLVAEVRDPRRDSGDRIGRHELASRDRSLTDRPDWDRPEESLYVNVFGRPLTIGGRYTMRTIYEENRLLDFDFFDTDNKDIDGDGNESELEDTARGKSPEDDIVRLNQGLQLFLFYPFTESIAAYVSARGSWANPLSSDVASKQDTWTIQRNESWLYGDRILGTPVGFQIGRQRIYDDREWWWDQNLDSARLHIDSERFHFELSVAEEFAVESTDQDFIDPEEDDIFRVLGHASWIWADRQKVGLYALYQDDHSGDAGSIGLCIPDAPVSSPFFTAGCVDRDREDPSDATLTWFGASADGRLKLAGVGTLHYWLDAAGVVGKETYLDYAGDPSSRRVAAVSHSRIEGWGLNAGATWQMRSIGRPRLTLAYAFGSGGASSEEADVSFRQTGLEDNNGRFRGVNDFRYYGELLDPELSNLHIVTGALGFPLLRKSSIEFVYHFFRQAEAAPFLRSVGFKRDPDGRHASIGHEWDVILGLEEWKHLEIEAIGAIFRAGKAFSPTENRLSYRAIAQVRFNF